MDTEVKNWLDFAKRDLDVARHLNTAFYPKPLEIVCYHCQQAAEKAIKAVIISLGSPGGLPKRHDLSFLLDQIHHMVRVDDEIYDCADALSPYGVASRYPNEMYLEPRHADQAVKWAETIFDWAIRSVE